MMLKALEIFETSTIYHSTPRNIAEVTSTTTKLEGGLLLGGLS